MKTDGNTSKFSDVPVRIKSWGYIIVVFAAMLLHPLSMIVIVSLLSLYALKEYFTMMSVKNNMFLYSIYSIVVPLFVSLYINNYCLFVSVIITYIVIPIIINSLFIKEKGLNLKLITGLTLCVFSIGHLFFIRELNNPMLQINGVKIVIFIVCLTELNDVFQYLTGKTFGKRKIVPKISPNKTVEGFLGGIFLTTILANIAGQFFLPSGNILIYTMIGLFIAIAGFCGDVSMSLIKRKAKVKDTGNLIPGHGGLLDRMDSLLFVLPILYWGFTFVYFT